MIEKVMRESINCCIGAYGATCSGKTYTMLGVKKFPGIIPCVLRDVLALETESSFKYSIKLGYLEIYNEKLRDLLNRKAELKLVEEKGEVDINGLTKSKVTSFDECLRVL